MARPRKNRRARGEERRAPRGCVKDTQPARKHVPLTSQCSKHLLQSHGGRRRRRWLLLVIIGLRGLASREAPKLPTAARPGSLPLGNECAHRRDELFHVTGLLARAVPR